MSAPLFSDAVREKGRAYAAEGRVGLDTDPSVLYVWGGAKTAYTVRVIAGAAPGTVVAASCSCRFGGARGGLSITPCSHVVAALIVLRDGVPSPGDT